MQLIKDILSSWGINSPPAFILGLGICIGLPLLLVAVGWARGFIAGVPLFLFISVSVALYRALDVK